MLWRGNCQALPAPAVVTLLPDPRLTRLQTLHPCPLGGGGFGEMIKSGMV